MEDDSKYKPYSFALKKWVDPGFMDSVPVTLIMQPTLGFLAYLNKILELGC